MRRVAAPMLGGLVTSFLTLEVLPVLYTIWRSHQLRRAQRIWVPIEVFVRGLAGRPVSLPDPM